MVDVVQLVDAHTHAPTTTIYYYILLRYRVNEHGSARASRVWNKEGPLDANNGPDLRCFCRTGRRSSSLGSAALRASIPERFPAPAKHQHHVSTIRSRTPQDK